MIYKFINCESVIAKIMADLNMSENKLRTTDMKEWIFEAVDQIGAPTQYIQKESGVDDCPILPIVDYQVPIPSDLKILDHVAYSIHPNGPWIPMRSNTSDFKDHNSLDIEPTHDPANKAFEEESIMPPPPPIIHKAPTSQSQLYTHNLNKYYDRMFLAYHQDAPSYFVKPGWIVANKRKGFIKISYKAIATDKRGYPLIPDLSSYQEAIYWYVTMKFSFSNWYKGQLTLLNSRAAKYAQNFYQFVQQQWHFYKQKAYADAMMPTQDEMVSIKNEWNKLVPEFQSEYSFNKHIGDPQIIYNDYYYGY